MERSSRGNSLLEVIVSLVLVAATTLVLLKRQTTLMQSITYHKQQWAERLVLDNRLEGR